MNTFALKLASRSPDSTARKIAEDLAGQFSATAAARDRAGGTPKIERDALRDSGLLNLIIPENLGGWGSSWPETLAIVRLFARVDSSIAHVFAFQHLMLATARLFGEASQWGPLFEKTVSNRWFWGNALNPLDTRTVSTPHEGWRELNGHKTFCSGATDSDMLIVSARQEGMDKLVIGAVPTARKGITVFQDWDNMGQRQTDSGSVNFEHVHIGEDEIFLRPGPLGSVFATLRPLIAQLIFANIFVGIAEGAFNEAISYTRNHARRWFLSPAETATEDPYVLRHYGEFWVALESARMLTDRAAIQLEEVWSLENNLNKFQRGNVAVSVATAKIAAARAGLDITSRMFEVIGARGTAASLGLDRYWRNLRTHTLHDPIEYKLREVGDWSLNEHIPTPSFYS